MLGFLKPKKKKSDQLAEEYRMELAVLRATLDDPKAAPEERTEALEKLAELARHHTQKINGVMEKKASGFKEERCDDSPDS